MISGKKFTFSFKTFPLPPPLALVLSMVKIRPETPRFRCCTFKKEKGVKMVSRVFSDFQIIFCTANLDIFFFRY